MSKIIKKITDNDTNLVSYSIQNNIWTILGNEEFEFNSININNLDSTINILVPLQQYISQSVLQNKANIGVYLSSDEDINTLKEFIEIIPIIAFNFETFRDGRAYSNAYLLKTRFGYNGIIRAIGDVLRDQLAYMSRCGFDEFVVREDKNINDAIKAFDDFSQNYQADTLVNSAYYNR